MKDSSVKRYYSERVKKNSRTDFLWQVGKTINGKDVSDEQLELIVKTIIDQLDLSGKDKVLDLGCGNGLLTKKISACVQEITGLDLTAELYKIALEYNSSNNIRYINENIFDIDVKQYKNKFSKVYLYEVVQHLSLLEVDKLLIILNDITSSNAIIFIGGILDVDRKWDFFDTDERKSRYFDSLLSDIDPLGTWYYKDYFKYLAAKNNLNLECKSQCDELYTSHYRFDCVLWKK